VIAEITKPFDIRKIFKLIRVTRLENGI